MLTLSDKEKWEPNYDLSLVDLIKSAGLKTYWLSNQGFLGEYDTPVASLASKSDETIFLKKGGSFNSTNYSDFDLIPKFAQVLEDQPKVNALLYYTFMAHIRLLAIALKITRKFSMTMTSKKE